MSSPRFLPVSYTRERTPSLNLKIGSLSKWSIMFLNRHKDKIFDTIIHIMTLLSIHMTYEALYNYYKILCIS